MMGCLWDGVLFGLLLAERLCVSNSVFSGVRSLAQHHQLGDRLACQLLASRAPVRHHNGSLGASTVSETLDRLAFDSMPLPEPILGFISSFTLELLNRDSGNRQ